MYGTIRSALNVNDYIVLTLPSQIKVNFNSPQTALTCSIVEPQNSIVKSCVSISPRVIKITLGKAITDVFQITVSNAITSPQSSSPTDSIQFYTQEHTTLALQDQQLTSIPITAIAGSLQSVTYTSLVTQRVGETDQLKLSIKVANPVMLNGTVQIGFPYWFQVAAANIYQNMIDTSVLACQVYSGSTSTPTACSFDSVKHTLTFTELFNSSTLAGGQTLTIGFNGLKNPVSTLTQPTLSIQTTDPLLGVIDAGVFKIAVAYPSVVTNISITASDMVVQETANYQLQFRLSVPMYSGCLVTVSLPYPDYDLSTDTIDYVQVFGLFGTLRYASYNVNTARNSFTITDACQTYALPNSAASIFIQGLTNPKSVKPTGNFTIDITDSNSGYIAQMTSANGVNFQAVSGSVQNISVTTDSLIVNATTNLTVWFTPSHSTSDLTYITIHLNDSDYQFISSGLSLISSNISNIFSARLQFLDSQTVVFRGFSPTLRANTTYFVKLGLMQIAPIVKNLSQLWVNIFQIASSATVFVYYLVDSGYASNALLSATGQFYKAYATPSSLTTSETTTYTFLFQTQSDIPLGGSLEISLPPEISVNSSLLSCMVQSVPSACSYRSNNNTIKIQGYFLDQLYPKLSDLSVIVNGLINPRSLEPTGQLYYRTYALNLGLMDSYTSTSTVITMTTASQFTTQNITSVSSYRVADSNTAFTFKISVLGDLQSNDKMLLQLPSQLTMPSSALLKCTSSLSKLTNQGLSCSLQTYNTLMITLSLKNDILSSLSAFDFTIAGFTNPSSGKPTDSFSISIYNSMSYLMATQNSGASLLSQLSIKMTLPQLLTTGYSIATSNQQANYEMTVTITFTAGQSFPVGSMLILTYPPQLGFNQSTFSITSSKSLSVPNITFNSASRKITVNNFFSLAVQGGSQVVLSITGFTNSNSSVATSSFQLDVNTLELYPINSIQSGLTVASKCNFPCLDCTLDKGGNPSTCSACSTKDIQPNYFILQNSQCVSSCSKGYYYQGSGQSGTCSLCDSSCASCDIFSANCTSCKTSTGFPYLYESQCLAQCQSYQITDKVKLKCLDCQLPCKNCSGSTTKCTSCYNNTYWLGGTCLNSCPVSGLYIPNKDNWVCQSCSSNCSTCIVTRDTCTACPSGYKLNKIDNTCILQCPTGTTEDKAGECDICSANCKTCLITTDTCSSCYGSQLLSNSKCVGSCPAGQTQSGSGCINCSSECATCINGEPSTCTSCKSGFFNYQYTQCVSKCPSPFVGKGEYCVDPNLRCDFGYSVSDNGTVCVLSAYTCNSGFKFSSRFKKCVPIPGLYVPFPFLLLTLLLTVLLVVYLRLRQQLKSTNVIQCVICLWAGLEPILYLTQFTLAIAFEHTTVLVLTLFGLVLFYPLNIYVIQVAIKRRFSKDQVLQHWAQEYSLPYSTILKLSLYHNQKLLRLLTCSFRGQTRFQAAFDDIAMNYLKPQLRATIINAVSSYLLIAVADIACIVTVEWGYQLLITCIESLVFVLVLLSLQVVDYFQMKRRHLQSHNYFKVEAKSIDMSTVRGNFDDSYGPDHEQNALQLKQKSQDRRALLEKITKDLDQMDKNKKNQDDLEHFLLQIPNKTAYPEGPLEGVDYQVIAEGDEDIQELMETQKMQSRNVNLIPNQSTLNHLAENRANLIDNESREDEFWDRCVSERDELFYGDPDALDQARELFAQINSEIVKQRLERQRLQDIMDYNARMAEQEGNDDQKIHLSRPRFQLEEVLGQFQRDQDGNYLIIKDQQGRLIDSVGRRVNRRGYLIDEEGNIVTQTGAFVLQSNLVDKTDDIPIKIFKQLFLPIDPDDVSQTSRSNKQVSAAFSKSEKTVVSGRQSEGMYLTMEEGNDHDHTTYMNGRRRGQRSMKSIGIDPASSQTSIVHHPDFRINSEGEPYMVDIHFGESEHLPSRKRLPAKKRKLKRLQTAVPGRNDSCKGTNSKQARRTLKLRQSATNVRNSSHDLRSQTSTFIIDQPSKQPIRNKSSQLPIRVSTGRSKSLKSLTSNNQNPRASQNQSFNSNNVGRLNNNSQDQTDELLNRSYQVNMFAIGGKKTKLRDSGSVTLKKQSIAQSKRRHHSSMNASDYQERASQGSPHRRSLGRAKNSQDTISEADSDLINRAIKPKVPIQLKRHRAQSRKKGGRREVSQDPEMFSINISVPAAEGQNKKSNKYKQLTHRPKQIKKTVTNPQDQSQGVPQFPFNIIDIYDKKRATIPYNSAHDPITHQLDRLLKREKQQVEDLRKQAFENQSTVKKPILPPPLNTTQKGTYPGQRDFVQTPNLHPQIGEPMNHPVSDFQLNQNYRQRDQFPNALTESAQTQDPRRYQQQAFDNQTTVKKQESLGMSGRRPNTTNKIQNNSSTITSPAANATVARVAFNQKGRLIMNQSVGDAKFGGAALQDPTKKDSMTSLTHNPLRPLSNEDPQHNNFFKGSSQSLYSSQAQRKGKAQLNQGQLLEEAQDLIQQLGGLKSRPVTQANQRRQLGGSRQDQIESRGGDFKAQFYPSIISPSLLSAQSISELNYLNQVHQNIESKGVLGVNKKLNSKAMKGYNEDFENAQTLKNSKPAFQAYANQNVPAIGLPPKANAKRQNASLAPQSNVRLQNVKDIYSQNVRTPSGIAGVQPKSQLRGISAYDQRLEIGGGVSSSMVIQDFSAGAFGGTPIAMISAVAQPKGGVQGQNKKFLFNQKSEEELNVNDPYRTLNKIFSQK